ncbi:flagellar hook assembly protein FlgD [Luteimonas sp. S4-F44]|uniref:flagellar hook capping FlgD N-terminal domain-containing protein n=1 Tax=Luteimonas sp. S4-F44 TaxID=2925842 RepID=UPI001F5379BD|nr:flagellar hook capping FlgD N-terminal domain-containing protein [Luteimonas sp. S4-F44]UNK43980.1 flagellar hook assembly protein FlgD [Luteimonas sp. S4-F44]
MSTISGDIANSLGLGGGGQAADKKDAALGQADFLRLMTEQLKHQDPLKPMENSAFLGQLAQFSTVQGIQDLNSSVDGFANAMASDQLLRGASLVGRDVVLPSAKLALPSEGSATGLVAAPSTGIVNFDVTDANGQVVHQFSVPATAAGEVAFAWDGTDAAGNRLPAGTYGIAARHLASSGEASVLSTYVRARVDSVSVGSDGLYLDLDGLGTAPIGYVLRVN